MKGIIKVLISGILATGGSFTVGKVYDTFIPKTAEDGFNGKGIKKASSEQEYRGIFEENKNDINSLKLRELTTDTETSEASKKLKKWCEDKLSKPLEGNDGETIVKFCEFKLSTLRGFLAVRDNIDFITTEEDYKISLFFLKNDTVGKSKVHSENITHENLKTGCESTLSKKVTETDKSVRGAINLYCKIQSIKTVEQLIKQKHPDGTIASEDIEGENLFEKGKYTNEFINLLKRQEGNENVSRITAKEKGKTNLKNGCMNGKNKKLSENLEHKFIDYVREACNKNKTNS